MNEQPEHIICHNGFYSPNQVVLAAIVIVIGLLPFLGERIMHPAQEIQNYRLRTVYTALAEPLAAAAKKLPVSRLIPSLRMSFLKASGLDRCAAWDSFFYTEAADSGVSPDDRMTQPAAPLAVQREAAVYGHVQKYSGGKQPYFVEQKIIPFSAEHPLRLLFFGDSQMHFIASGMRRAAGNNRSISIEEISVHSSGFLRSDYYNWPKKLEAVLHGYEEIRSAAGAYIGGQNGTVTKIPRFHAAVMILGMNDYQDIYTAEGALLTAGSQAWEDMYKAKIRQHLAIVLHDVPRIYWLRLPEVRKNEYNDKIRYINTVQAAVAQEFSPASVRYLSLTDFAAEYRYGDIIVTEDGSKIILMQSDGVHYTIPGGEYLMKHFLHLLQDDFLFEESPSAVPELHDEKSMQ